MAPHNVIRQNTITVEGEIVDKPRLTHNQSKVFSSGTSVNSRVAKDQLQDCMYGFCICRLVHYILSLRTQYPSQRVFLSKIYWKSVYRRAHVHWSTAIQSMSQDGSFLHIALRATFGGAPNPYDWSVISESVTDLANLLMNDPEWDPTTTHSPIQHQLPPNAPLDAIIPFAQALPTVVSAPIDCCAKTDVYLDDETTVSLDDPAVLPRARAAVLLAIHIVARPLQTDEPIPRVGMIAIAKLLAEGAMEETKVILGWLFDTRRLTISLTEHKFVAWSNKLKTIKDRKTSDHDELDTILGQLTHVATVMPQLLHFLGRLRSLKYVASKRRMVKLQQKHIADINLALTFLHIARRGISMNLFSFRQPSRIYRADACPWGIGGYSSSGRAWRYELPTHLLWRATLNMLEFIAATIGSWIDLIKQTLPPLSCILSMTDSTTSAG